MSELVVLRGATVFDGTGAPAATVDVAVRDGRIVEVGAGLAGDTTVPLAGLGLLPGFVDCHVHLMAHTMDPVALTGMSPSYRLLRALPNLRRTLAAGVTTVRDADGADAGLRRAIAERLVTGPRLLVAISMISQTGGRADHETPAGVAFPAFDVHPGRPDGVADGPAAVRAVARRLVRAGADVLKLAVSDSATGRGDPRRPQLAADEIAAAVAVADAAGLPVMVHSHSAAGTRLAVRAGVRSIEHGSDIDEGTIAEMARRGTWLVPTLVATRAALRAAPPGAGADALAELLVRQLDVLTRARRAGVRVAMGSDAGMVPHGRNLDELAELHAAGLSATETLVAATSGGAALLDRPTIGTIAPGYDADLVVVDGAPGDLAGLPGRIRAVLIAGRTVAGRLPEAVS